MMNALILAAVIGGTIAQPHESTGYVGSMGFVGGVSDMSNLPCRVDACAVTADGDLLRPYGAPDMQSIVVAGVRADGAWVFRYLRVLAGFDIPVTAYSDVLGTATWIDSELLVDGVRMRHGSTQFAYTVRAGLRVEMDDDVFIAVAGEYGLTGDVSWRSELTVGLALF